MPLKIVEVPRLNSDDRLLLDHLEDGELFRWLVDDGDYVYMKVKRFSNSQSYRSGWVNLHTGHVCFPSQPPLKWVERLDAVLEFTATK